MKLTGKVQRLEAKLGAKALNRALLEELEAAGREVRRHFDQLVEADASEGLNETAERYFELAIACGRCSREEIELAADGFQRSVSQRKNAPLKVEALCSGSNSRSSFSYG